jgi:hypothetical protein
MFPKSTYSPERLGELVVLKLKLTVTDCPVVITVLLTVIPETEYVGAGGGGGGGGAVKVTDGPVTLSEPFINM